jgi:DNA-binding SARP family transcriptional activator
VSVLLLGEQRALAQGRSLLESAEDGAGAPLSPTALSLLAYLVLQRGKAISGETIAADLWPESRASGKSFHKTLGRLRDGLGSVLGARGRDVVRRREGLYTLDLARLRVDAFEVEDWLAAADAAEGPLRAELWWRVVELYRGDLGGPDAPEWALEGRARLHDAVTRMLRRLSRWEEERGNLPAAITAAERLTQLEPDDEAAHRLVMRLHARSGDRVAALQHYHRLEATLQAEVGPDVAPEDKTQDLYRKISAHEARVEQATEATWDDVGD